MKKTILPFLLFCFTQYSQAQELTNEYISVIAGAASTIWFPADVKMIDPACDDNVYSIKKDGRKVKITPIGTKESSPEKCMLLVQEGDNEHTRTHRFIIVFASPDAELDNDKIYIDVHTIEKLRERVGRQSGATNAETSRTAASGPSTDTETVPEPDPQSQNSGGGSQEDLVIDGERIPRAQIDRQVKQRMDAFRLNLEILGNKSDPRRNPVTRVIDHTMKFFNHDKSRKVTVKNGDKAPVVRTIYEYLKNISILPYRNIKIEYSNLQFIGTFEKNADGSWWGILCYEQKFTGARDGQPYVDVSKKRIRIQVKVTEFVTNDGTTKKVEVFLGDIGMNDSQQ